MAQARKQQRVNPRITAAQWHGVGRLLRQDRSPEQVAGRRGLERQPAISHERIHQHAYADKQRGGTLWRHPRCQQERRERYASGRDRRGRTPARRGISGRPTAAARKRRPGDWEADTIMGRSHRQALVSVVGRKSKLGRLQKVGRNAAELVAQAAAARLAPPAVKAVTSGNGREFAHHQQIGQS